MQIGRLMHHALMHPMILGLLRGKICHITYGRAGRRSGLQVNTLRLDVDQAAKATRNAVLPRDSGRSKYGAMVVPDANRLCALEATTTS